MWLGHDEALDAQVAIKVLSGSLIDDLDVRNRFLEEARILRRADSERLVRVHDIGELEDGRPYFVMSYADRGTLADRMRERPLPVNQALAYAEEIAYGVKVLNELGVIHRDLKPSNVLFQSTSGGRERLLIADLGLAKALAHASGAFTLPVGTPGYMSPEQARFGGGLDVRADVYGLGALTYHMITGRPPGPAPVKTPPSALREGLSPAFDEVILRALEVDREKRYPTAEAFAEALATLRPTSPPPAPGGAHGQDASPAAPEGETAEPSAAPASGSGATPPDQASSSAASSSAAPSSAASSAQPAAASSPQNPASSAPASSQSAPPSSPPDPTPTAVDEPLSTFNADVTVSDTPHPGQAQPPYSQGPGRGLPEDVDSTRLDWGSSAPSQQGQGDGMEAVTIVDPPGGRPGTVPFGAPPAPGPPAQHGPQGGPPPGTPRTDDRTVALPVPPQGPQGPGQAGSPDLEKTAALTPPPQGGPYPGPGQQPHPFGFPPAQQGQGRLGRLRKSLLPGGSKQAGGGTGSPAKKIPAPMVFAVVLLCAAVAGGLALGTLFNDDKDDKPDKPPLPQDFVQVADASGKIRAAVPRAWTVDRQEPTWVPSTVALNDAQARPVLRATPNVAQFKGDGTAPGVFIGLTKDVAQGKLPPPGVTGHRTCTRAGTQNYTSPDKTLTGTITRFTGCRVGTPSVTEVGLRDSRGAFGVWIRIKENDNRDLTKTILDNLKLTAP
ncbi:hypothetical protein Arub01_58190 [Actinomadura rubrobrunea]|uniref:non-specific serine/threonine protein kinase n=1 Tax=Actinomadura rubrobrunea TaxID=115335 RepID=A0A9W6UXE2_9ACTN|nr:hypothetical protein Arub01_58190 [Actinomadura rubrobrunea]